MSMLTVIVPMHKELAHPKGDHFLPIFVGRELSEGVDFQIVGDDTGDNISAKNRTFCELTAHYWVWRNMKLSEYVGLCHYRRYFSLGGGRSIVPLEQIDNIEHIDSERVERLMRGRDILLVEPMVFRESLTTHYKNNHYGDDLEVVKEVLLRQCPEYLASYERVMSGNKFVPYNMFITSAARFCDYSEWLFSILFELEGLIDVADRDAFQQRVFGYIAEHLLGVYVAHHGLRPRYLPISLVDGYGDGRKVVAGQSKFVRVKHNLMFAFSKK